MSWLPRTGSSRIRADNPRPARSAFRCGTSGRLAVGLPVRRVQWPRHRTPPVGRIYSKRQRFIHIHSAAWLRRCSRPWDDNYRHPNTRPYQRQGCRCSDCSQSTGSEWRRCYEPHSTRHNRGRPSAAPRHGPVHRRQPDCAGMQTRRFVT
jgi:hypothetical protein